MWSHVIEDQIARARVAQRLAAAERDAQARLAGAARAGRSRGRRASEPAPSTVEPVCRPARDRAWA